MIKNNFPLEISDSKIKSLLKPLRKVAALDWMLLTPEKSDVSSTKILKFEDIPYSKSLV